MSAGQSTPVPWTGVVLAGGASSRMGTDKAWIEWRGEPMIVRQARLLREAGASEVLVSGRAGVDYAVCRARVVIDELPGQGPLAGIAAALRQAAHPLVLLLAVDLPRMEQEVLRLLLDRSSTDTGAVPWVNGRCEPLAAVYPRAEAGSAQARVADGRLAVQEWVAEMVGAGRVVRVEVPPLRDGCFANWNTPADVASEARLGAGGADR